MNELNVLSNSIINLLVEGERIDIPNIGYLMVNITSNSRVVIFKAIPVAERSEKSVSPAKGSLAESLYNQISVPLQEGKSVALPEVGVFSVSKSTVGILYFSFSPSLALRRKMNQSATDTVKSVVADDTLSVTEATAVAPAPVVQTNTDTESATETDTPSTDENETVATENLSDTETKHHHRHRKHRKRRRKLTEQRVLNLVIFVLALILVWFIIKSMTKKPTLIGWEPKEETLNLWELAKENYGNEVYWVDIYEANKDVLTSPINIPADISASSLIIPLKDSLDIVDTSNIVRAKNRGDKIISELNRKKDEWLPAPK
ncbi:MAG: hypothetical protein LBR66_01280 [Candidatus Symbiothrix sp.]|jgi:hypothetical protein|nr:hypothetical protein [Candidatus Symbiothrix sp.]